MGTYWGADGKTVDGRYELAGRNIEEVFVYNALAITNANALYSSAIDLSKYRSVEVFVSSSLDQTIDFGPVLDGNNAATTIWNGTAFVTMPVTTIPIGNATISKYIMAGRYDFLYKSPPKVLAIYLKCATAPTVGSVTVKIWGVPN